MSPAVRTLLLMDGRGVAEAPAGRCADASERACGGFDSTRNEMNHQLQWQRAISRELVNKQIYFHPHLWNFVAEHQQLFWPGRLHTNEGTSTSS